MHLYSKRPACVPVLMKAVVAVPFSDRLISARASATFFAFSSHGRGESWFQA